MVYFCLSKGFRELECFSEQELVGEVIRKKLLESGNYLEGTFKLEQHYKICEILKKIHSSNKNCQTFLDRSFNFSLLLCIKPVTSTVNFPNTNPILSLSDLNPPCIFPDHIMKSEFFAGHASSRRCSQACLHRILSSCSLCTPHLLPLTPQRSPKHQAVPRRCVSEYSFSLCVKFFTSMPHRLCHGPH